VLLRDAHLKALCESLQKETLGNAGPLVEQSAEEGTSCWIILGLSFVKYFLYVSLLYLLYLPQHENDVLPQAVTAT
jgi:hypothetical protein